MYIKLIIKILSLFDFFYKKKIINFLKKEKINNIDVLIDVGSHHGETISLFRKNFSINSFFGFEPSPINYKILKNNIEKLNDKKIKIFNYALGDKKGELQLNQSIESQSTTLLNVNKKSKYFDRKKRVLSLRSGEYFNETFFVKVETLKNFINENKINNIGFLKIDTEGYDFNVIMGLGDNIQKVRYIYFEHHFHDMFKKKYTLTKVHNYLKEKNFEKVFKIKMMFRKTFEYIYCNKNL